MITSFNLLFFAKEAEWKLKTKYMSYEDKIKKFFEMYEFVVSIGEDNLYDANFINNEDINKILE